MQDEELYSKIVYQTDAHQVRLVINSFRGVEYLHLRKYYMDFDENWCPSSEGVSMPLDFDNSRELFSGLAEILSLAERQEVIKEHFEQLIKDIYQ